jgi:hypothetical protein
MNNKAGTESQAQNAALAPITVAKVNIAIPVKYIRVTFGSWWYHSKSMKKND